MEDQKTAQALANEALGAIGDDMLERTGGDRWRAGQPLLTEPEQPPPVAEPTVEPTPTAAPEEVSPESKPTSEPGEKLFLGKWKSEEEAIRGYHEAVHMGNSAKAERDILASRLSKIEQTLAPPVKEETDPLAEFEIYGVPKEVAERAMKHSAQKAVQELFAPTFSRIQADQAIVEKYPEYRDRFNDLTQFVDANPDVRNSVEEAEAAGKFGLAREYAWLRFVNSNVQKIETQLKEEAAIRTEEIKAVRKDASVGTPSRTSARTKPSEEGLSPERFQYLKDLAKAGHPAPLWRETIGATLPKDFDNLLGG